MAKARYKTKQMTELHTFLQSVQGQHVTVQEIREYFKDREIAVGTTTIYRQLEKMVKDGLVEKYVVEGTNSACFEYIGESETSDYESCYHCKCEKCGKLIHLHCEDVVKLEQHLMDSHGFRMDPCRTVFYGLCEECRSAEDGEKESETVHIRSK